MIECQNSSGKCTKMPQYATEKLSAVMYCIHIVANRLQKSAIITRLYTLHLNTVNASFLIFSPLTLGL